MNFSDDDSESDTSVEPKSPKRKSRELPPPSSDSDDGPFPPPKVKSVVNKPANTPMESFPCKSCGKKLLSLHGLRRHIRELHKYPEWQYVCTYCPTRFMRRTNVRRHIQDKHPEQEQPSSVHVTRIRTPPINDKQMGDLRTTLSTRKHDNGPNFNIVQGDNTPTQTIHSMPTLVLPNSTPPRDIQRTIANTMATSGGSSNTTIIGHTKGPQ